MSDVLSNKKKEIELKIIETGNKELRMFFDQLKRCLETIKDNPIQIKIVESAIKMFCEIE